MGAGTGAGSPDEGQVRQTSIFELFWLAVVGNLMVCLPTSSLPAHDNE
jgi:hypothetical protein